MKYSVRSRIQYQFIACILAVAVRVAHPQFYLGFDFYFLCLASPFAGGKKCMRSLVL